MTRIQATLFTAASVLGSLAVDYTAMWLGLA